MDSDNAQRHFTLLNEERIKRVREALGHGRGGLFDLLALLFHTNDPKLPGYVSDEAPAGLPGYAPGRFALEEAKRILKAEGGGGPFKVKARRSFDILGVCAVGDLGTLIATAEPLFDLWLFLREGIGEEGREALAEKAAAIVEWYAEQRITLRIHAVEPAALRRGETGIRTGHCADEQWPRLLVDRLYAQGAWLGGHPPAWWRVPPEREGEYDACLQELAAADPRCADAWLDLGPVAPIPPLELFRAATEWLFAGVDRPYDYLPRILLAEACALAGDKVKPLSGALKEAVHFGERNLGRLDPLVLGYRQIARHLGGEGEEERLDALRRAVYLLAGIHLSRRDREEEEDKRELMRELVDQWKWAPERLEDLDARPDWRLERVLQERRSLVATLSQCHRALAAYGRAQGEAVREALPRFALLRQKLYAAFERKGGKVELLNFDPDSEMAESHLLIHQGGPHPAFAAAPSSDAAATEGGYALHRGDSRHLDPEPLKRAGRLIELLAWCHFNRVYGARTLFALQPPEGRVEARELRLILEGFQRLAPNGRLPEGGRDAFDRPTEIAAAALFINTGVVDSLTRRTRQGIHLSSDNIDVFSYGSRNESLAETFDLVLVTSRREVLTFRYRDEDALIECLRDYLGWFPKGSAPPPRPTAHCYSSDRGELIARRFEELFDHLTAALYRAGGGDGRYVLKFRGAYHLFEFDAEGRLQSLRADALPALYSRLGAPRAHFSPIDGAPATLAGTPLPYLFKLNREGVVQFFYLPLGGQADVFILDERGSLFFQTMAFDNPAMLLRHHQRFFEAVLPRRNLAGGGSEEVEYYRIGKKKDGRYGVAQETVERDESGRRYFQVQVIAEVLEDKRSQLTIYCNDEEFSSLEHGERLLHEVAGHILSKRKSGERYPIYITDIDITRLLGGTATEGGVQTIHFLTYKKRIEDRLADALQKI